MTMKELFKYLSIYTTLELSEDNQSISIDWDKFIKNKYVYSILLNRAILNIFINWKLNSVSINYLKDIVTNYFREMAWFNWIDDSRYWWTIKLFDIHPMYSIIYNTIEWFNNVIQSSIITWNKINLDYPITEISDLLEEDFNKIKNMYEVENYNWNSNYSSNIQNETISQVKEKPKTLDDIF